MQVMYVQGLVVAYMIFQIVRKIFFGELRAAEYEVRVGYFKLILSIYDHFQKVEQTVIVLRKKLSLERGKRNELLKFDATFSFVYRAYTRFFYIVWKIFFGGSILKESIRCLCLRR